MKALLIRTGSFSAQNRSFGNGSPGFSPSVHDSTVKHGSAPSPGSLHFPASRRNDSTPVTGIRRAFSETDVIRSAGGYLRSSSVGSASFPAIIPEEEYQSEGEEGVGGIGSFVFSGAGFDTRNYVGEWTEGEIPGGGIGKGRRYSGGGGGSGYFAGGNADRSKIDAYYQEMLKSNPSNSLLLRNYGRFLHEVVGDAVKAEEYYGRAILASPGDGEVLSLYGKLIWETQRDEGRAKSYFDQAVRASPDDTVVLGSYAHFMWEAGDEEDEEEGGSGESQREGELSAAMAEALKV